MSQVVIASVSGFLQLVERQPRLRSVASIDLLVGNIKGIKKGCSCTDAEAKARQKKALDTALGGAPVGDIQKIKEILQIESFCYYASGPGGLRLVCR
jgi:hypothetical protein